MREKQREKKKGLNPSSLKKFFFVYKDGKKRGGCVRLINSAIRKGKGIRYRGEWVNGAGIVVVVKQPESYGRKRLRSFIYFKTKGVVKRGSVFFFFFFS